MPFNRARRCHVKSQRPKSFCTTASQCPSIGLGDATGSFILFRLERYASQCPSIGLGDATSKMLALEDLLAKSQCPSIGLGDATAASVSYSRTTTCPPSFPTRAVFGPVSKSTLYSTNPKPPLNPYSKTSYSIPHTNVAESSSTETLGRRIFARPPQNLSRAASLITARPARRDGSSLQWEPSTPTARSKARERNGLRVEWQTSGN